MAVLSANALALADVAQQPVKPEAGQVNGSPQPVNPDANRVSLPLKLLNLDESQVNLETLGFDTSFGEVRANREIGKRC